MGHKVDTAAEGKKLMELSREWSKSAATNDTAKTLSYWAEDALVLSPGQATLKGKDAIREMIAGTAQIPGFKMLSRLVFPFQKVETLPI
jgi:ketosteroid isomerase-like protein